MPVRGVHIFAFPRRTCTDTRTLPIKYGYLYDTPISTDLVGGSPQSNWKIFLSRMGAKPTDPVCAKLANTHTFRPFIPPNPKTKEAMD